MDFIDKIRELAARIPKQLDHIQTEEATKNALVMPFITASRADELISTHQRSGFSLQRWADVVCNLCQESVQVERLLQKLTAMRSQILRSFGKKTFIGGTDDNNRHLLGSGV